MLYILSNRDYFYYYYYYYHYYGQKNTPPFRNLITSVTDPLPSLISFSNRDNITVDYIIVNNKVTNITSGIGNYRSGTAIYSGTV